MVLTSFVSCHVSLQCGFHLSLCLAIPMYPTWTKLEEQGKCCQTATAFWPPAQSWLARPPLECYARRQTGKAWQQVSSPVSKRTPREVKVNVLLLPSMGKVAVQTSRCQLVLVTTVYHVLRTVYLVFLLRKYSAHVSFLLPCGSLPPRGEQ